MGARGTEAALAAAGAQSKDAASGLVHEVDLSHGLPELARGAGLFSEHSRLSLAELVLALDQQATNPATRGWLVSLGAGDLSLAQAEELGARWEHLRGDRPVVCHAHGYGNATYWFARRACSEVWLSPAGDLDTVGLASQSVYLKSLLDKLGVRAEVLHAGRYKSAGEPLTRTAPSPEAALAMRELLSSLRATWLSGMSNPGSGSNVEDSGFLSMVEKGPWTANQAEAQKLVHRVGFLSEARQRAEGLAVASRTVRLQAGAGEGSPVLQAARALRQWSRVDEATLIEPIVVLPLSGAIGMEGTSGPLGDSTITAEVTTKLIRRLRTNPAVRAVVLRIDSPGGSALASDLIWHELYQLREEKPLVASLATVAASGGYYLASAARSIVADRTSLIGSIGVVGGKLEVTGALSEHGIDTVTMAASDEAGATTRATYQSPLTVWDAATRERVQAELEATYDLFIRRVALGRGLEQAQVREVAEGRVWSGAQGLELKLVDELGGLADAVRVARRLAHLEEDAGVRVESAADPFLEMLGFEPPEDSGVHLRALRLTLGAPLSESTAVWLGGWQPLLAGEVALTATPFAVTVR